MRWQELTITTGEESTEAVADLFYQAGAQGVVIEDPRDVARYLEEECWDYYELPPEMLAAGRVTLKCYLPMDEKLPCRIEELRQSLTDLAHHFHCCESDLRLSEVAEEDWANAWKAYFKPEKVGDRVVVVPSWENYQSAPGELAIRLDPGMAFGTGTHPTTAMCIRALEKYLQPGQRVIDVGTGSGILAITAAFLGAGPVLAVDYDSVAVETASENVRLNGMDEVVSVRESDLLTGIATRAGLISANIVAGVITRLVPQAARRLDEGGILIASGIIRPRLLEVEAALVAAGLCIVEVQSLGDWVTLVSVKEDAA